MVFSIVLIAMLQAAPQVDNRPVGFTLWQLPEQTRSQMMSYVIKTPNGKVIVIDGGMTGDAPYLRKFLKNLGDKVDIWFLTHPHLDHVNAFIDILKKPDGLKIGCICASLPTEEWMKKYDAQNAGTLVNLNKALRETGRSTVELSCGQKFILDGVNIQVLGIKNPEILTGTVNNSSIVLRVWDSTKSVLFLGDTGFEAGKKLLKSEYASCLHADYVQMAHHGQDGAGEDVYKAIKPSYCLWPTPIWLWNVDNGGGIGSGPWKTLETRKWIKELAVKDNYVTGVDGLVKID
ncbi:MBL fold metallo-hydrolase [bacterium]|nr:MBL fold metallo-hydrolase [bacterium]